MEFNVSFIILVLFMVFYEIQYITCDLDFVLAYSWPATAGQLYARTKIFFKNPLVVHESMLRPFSRTDVWHYMTFSFLILAVAASLLDYDLFYC